MLRNSVRARRVWQTKQVCLNCTLQQVHRWCRRCHRSGVEIKTGLTSILSISRTHTFIKLYENNRIQQKFHCRESVQAPWVSRSCRLTWRLAASSSKLRFCNEVKQPLSTTQCHVLSMALSSRHPHSYCGSHLMKWQEVQQWSYVDHQGGRLVPHATKNKAKNKVPPSSLHTTTKQQVLVDYIPFCDWTLSRLFAPRMIDCDRHMSRLSTIISTYQHVAYIPFCDWTLSRLLLAWSIVIGTCPGCPPSSLHTNT